MVPDFQKFDFFMIVDNFLFAQFAPGSSSEVLVTSADSRVRVIDGVDLVHKFKGMLICYCFLTNESIHYLFLEVHGVFSLVEIVNLSHNSYPLSPALDLVYPGERKNKKG